MITIFNGRKRSLGKKEKEEYYIQVDVDFRQHLHLLKGAKLAVFMAIALHTDEDGISFPSVKLLCKETGYNRETVFDALAELEEIEINGAKLLCRYKSKAEDGTFQNNQYLIFPTDDDQIGILPSTEKPDTVKNQHGKTSTLRRTNTKEEPILKKNQEDSCAIAPPTPKSMPKEKSAEQGGSAGKKNKPRDVNLDNQAVIAFRDNFGFQLNEDQRQVVATSVLDIRCWQKTLATWKLNNYSPKSLDGMLEHYGKQGNPSDVLKPAPKPELVSEYTIKTIVGGQTVAIEIPLSMRQQFDLERGRTTSNA